MAASTLPPLQPLVDAHAEQLHRLFLAIGMIAPDAPPAQQLAWIRTCAGPDVVGRVLVVEGELVGGGQLTIIRKHRHAAELGMWVHPAHQRRGYGTAIVRGLVALAVGPLGLLRVGARTSGRNIASRRTLCAAGFQQEGRLRDALRGAGGQLDDEVIFGITATDWAESSGAPDPREPASD